MATNTFRRAIGALTMPPDAVTVEVPVGAGHLS
jgi:hypothetical protein